MSLLLSCFLLSSSLFEGEKTPIGQSLSAQPIEQVHITATRQKSAVDEIASPVSVLTAEDLEAHQITRLIDALQLLPGVSVARSGGIGGAAQLRLRGAEANHILVVIDGLVANDPAAGDEFQFEHLSVTEIERVELVRGPLSSAYGSGALAGVINIVTRQGGSPRLGFRSEGGSFDQRSLGFSFGGSLRGFQLAGGLDWQETDGVNITPKRARLNGISEKDGYENFTANLKLGYDFDGASAGKRFIDAALRYEASDSDYDAVSFDTGLPFDSDRVSETDKLSVSIRAGLPIIEGLWQQSFRVSYFDSKLDNEADGGFDGSTASDRWGFYADSLFTPFKDHRINLFVDHEESDFKQRGIASPFGNPNYDESLSVTGFGADYTGELVGGLTLNLAIRQDDNSDFGDFTSWRSGLSARIPGVGTRFFASLARGQKAPTFIERFGFFPDQFRGNENLRPERSRQWEIGFEQNFGQAYKIAISYFSARLKAEIDGFAFDPETRLFTAQNRANQSTRRGVEIVASARLDAHLSFEGHYSYVKSREADEAGGFFDEQRRPRHQASLSGRYEIDNNFGFTLDMDYTGKSDDLFFPPFPAASELVRLDDYILVRLAARYQISKNLALHGRIENALGEAYEDVFGFNTPGTAGYLGLAYHF